MRNNMRKSMLVLVFTGFLAAVPMLAFGDAKAPSLPEPPQADPYIVHQVRHELLMLPYYGVFDNLEYKVNGKQVELLGQVVDPVLKSSAENVVKDIKGVTSVTNHIKVLPLSPYDNWIRRAEFRAVFGGNDLFRYAMGANPAVHIIVDHGNVTLVGEVATQMDKTFAGIQANGVPGVFSVTNKLRVG